MNLILIILLFAQQSFGQNSYEQKLKDDIQKANQPEKQALIQHELAEWYRSNEEFQKALETARQSLMNAEKSTKQAGLVAISYALLATVYSKQENFDQAKNYVDSALQSAQKHPESTAQSYAKYAEAYLYNALLEPEKTVQSLHEALSKKPQPHTDFFLDSKIYYLLYGVYSNIDEEVESLNYAQLALTAAQKSGNINQLVNCQVAMSVANKFRYKRTKNKADLDRCMAFLNQGISLYQKHSDQVANNSKAILHLNKASYLLAFFNNRKTEIREQINQNIQLTLALAEHIEKNGSYIASSYGILSELSKQDNDYKAAESYLIQAYDKMSVQKQPYYYTLGSIVRNLSDLYAHTGDYEKAFEYQKKTVAYNNLLFNEKTTANTKRLEAQFSFQQKKQEIEVLKDQTLAQQRQKNLLIGLIIIGAIGAFFMIRSSHFNLKYSRSREKQLLAEKNQHDSLIKAEKEEKARLKVEQELLELQQQKLQNEVLASQLQLQYKNEVLQQVKDKLSSVEGHSIQQILRQESILDNNFEKAKFQIQDLHPNFFKNINELAQQKLTALDQKYCAYLYLGMETKQIAQLLNVEPKTVRVVKYRIKQKLNLDAETNLVNYLKALG